MNGFIVSDLHQKQEVDLGKKIEELHTCLYGALAGTSIENNLFFGFLLACANFYKVLIPANEAK